MPLVVCPDCGQEVSDAAEACPRCARPLSAGGFRGRVDPPPDGRREEQRNPVPEPTSSTGAAATLTSDYEEEVHPWVRYFARLIDISLASLVLGLVMAFVNPEYVLEEGSEYGIAWLAILLWVPFEAWWLAATGTTPGKALLRTRVTTAEGHPPGFAEALGRSFRVWFFGLGTGFPLISLFTMAYQHGKLKKNGRVSWDKSLDTRVEHAQLSPGRVIIAVVLMAVIIMLSVLPA